MSKEILLTGIKPTGKLHLGNYFGAIRPFLELRQNIDQDLEKSYFFVANYHALTSVNDADVLREQTLDIIADYIALGLDPTKNTIFLQSHIPEHTELQWILSNLVTVAYLERCHAYKDAVANGKAANAGLFSYPILMAADILMYGTTLVPVGKDQKQHLEYAIKIAQKFNAVYGQTFVLPKPVIEEYAGIVTGLDGRKMSKSYGNTIEIFEEEDSLRKKVMSIKTDSKGSTEPKDPESCNIFALHKLVQSSDELEILADRYQNGTISYKESKELLLGKVMEYFADARHKRLKIEQDKHYLADVLDQGAREARKVAQNKMEEVRHKVGLL
jgi:tryptophanyl-tRNA synthetase